MKDLVTKNPCDHRGEHLHKCESVWVQEIKTFGLKISVTCLKCSHRFKFRPDDAMGGALVLDEDDRVLKVAME